MKDWLEKLRNSRKLIIVEGKKDKNALEKLGVKNVISISRKPIYAFVEGVHAKEVIILTDLDKEGKKLYHTLKHNLQKRGIEVDNYFREYLFKNSRITQMEGLAHYLEKKKLV